MRYETFLAQTREREEQYQASQQYKIAQLKADMRQQLSSSRIPASYTSTTASTSSLALTEQSILDAVKATYGDTSERVVKRKHALRSYLKKLYTDSTFSLRWDNLSAFL